MKKMLWAIGALAAVTSSLAQAQRVDGFGSNVPLSFAVRQIVPNDYVVRFEPSVDQSARVSWSGSDDWHSVLLGLARSRGLSYRVQGQDVIIAGSGGQQASPSAAAPVAAAPVAPMAATQAPISAAQQSQGIRTGGMVLLPTRSTAPVRSATSDAPSAPSFARQADDNLPPPVGSGAVPSRAAPQPAQPPSPAPAPVVAAPAPPAAAPQREARGREDVRPPAVERERRGQEARAGSSAAPRAAERAADRPGLWRAPRAETLNNVLGDWADRAGWTVVFTTRVVYELQAGAEFDGEFVEAATARLRSVRANPQPHATFYRGNRVLVVADPTSN